MQKEIDGFEKYEIIENSLIDREIKKTGVVVYEKDCSRLWRDKIEFYLGYSEKGYCSIKIRFRRNNWEGTHGWT